MSSPGRPAASRPSTDPSAPARPCTRRHPHVADTGNGGGGLSWVLIAIGGVLVLLGIGAIVLLLVRRNGAGGDDSDDGNRGGPRGGSGGPGRGQGGGRGGPDAAARVEPGGPGQGPRRGPGGPGGGGGGYDPTPADALTRLARPARRADRDRAVPARRRPATRRSAPAPRARAVRPERLRPGPVPAGRRGRCSGPQGRSAGSRAASLPGPARPVQPGSVRPARPRRTPARWPAVRRPSRRLDGRLSARRDLGGWW